MKFVEWAHYMTCHCRFCPIAAKVEAKREAKPPQQPEVPDA